jgi:Helix-turn-helix domain
VDQQTQNSEVLNMKEVAAILRCSKAHVANLINGKVRGVQPLPCIRAGRRNLIRRRSFEAWQDSVERAGVAA